mmetsp:Transcript_924/g.1131  ORF Transcript_924/g.1131 Transcript_924/m.1131 type:complete len:111 (+) Transcript_924:248-580(+)
MLKNQGRTIAARLRNKQNVWIIFLLLIIIVTDVIVWQIMTNPRKTALLGDMYPYALEFLFYSGFSVVCYLMFEREYTISLTFYKNARPIEEAGSNSQDLELGVDYDTKLE